MKFLPNRFQLITAPLILLLLCLLLYVMAPPRHNFALWLDLNLLIVLLPVGMCVLLATIRTYRTRVGILAFAVATAAALAVTVWMTDRLLLEWLTPRRHQHYLRWTEAGRYLRLTLAFFAFAWMGTLFAAQRRAAALDEKLSEQTSAADLLRDAELYKLRQQLQPHFLFNSLNAISSLTLMAPDKAQEMIGRLSDFLRSSVRRESASLLPLSDELEYIGSYLSIESVRFGDRLQVVIEVEDEADHGAFIPPFLLQPLIENAIKFGLYGTSGALQLAVCISRRAELLQIRVTNPFDPVSTPPRGTGFGLEGVRRRLVLLYGRADLLETQATDTTFTTTLKIPQVHAQSTGY